MCFSKSQSFINAIILVIGSIYVYPKYRLSIPLIFLALMDLLQGLLYINIENNKSTRFLTTLAWIHICFQPLFVNIFASNFDKDFKYWNVIFFICILFALHNITILKRFDIQNDPDCVKKNKYDDFCSKKPQSYIGKYHLGYKFKTDNTIYPYFDPALFILMVVPSLVTKSRLLGLTWATFIGIIYTIFNNIGEGELSAIWCFSSIIIALPVAFFDKQISKLLF